MFTGIVETLALVREVQPEGPARRLVLFEPAIAPGARIGDSIAINGCCLTVVAQTGETLAFQAGPETLSRTNLGRLAPGDRVNVERALVVSDRLGGHFVQGHVDGIGQVVQRERLQDWHTLWVAVPADLARQMVPKGSVAVDGVSLTLVEVQTDRFSVALIPHTLEKTTLGLCEVGQSVNIETDILGKYVRRFLETVAS